MFLPIAVIFRLLQICSKSVIYICLYCEVMSRSHHRYDDEISTSPRNIAIYMTLFEQNCNNLKMSAIGPNMQLYFLLLTTTINPHYHSCVFMTDIYLTISLSAHNGDVSPKNVQEYLLSPIIHVYIKIQGREENTLPFCNVRFK